MKKIEICPGQDIKDAVKMAIGEAAYDLVEFEFNDVIVFVDNYSKPDRVVRDWWRAVKGHISKVIGPIYQEVLDPEVIKREEETDREREIARERELEKAREEDRKKRDALFEKINGENFASKDQDELTRIIKLNSEDPYSNATIQYALAWGILMQLALKEGKELKDVWESCSHEADVEGVTGFMHGMAAKLLSYNWVHGEELKMLHNASFGVTSETGVVNPNY